MRFCKKSWGARICVASLLSAANLCFPSIVTASEFGGLYAGIQAGKTYLNNNVEQSINQFTDIKGDGMSWGALVGLNIHGPSSGIVMGVEADISFNDTNASTATTGGLFDDFNATQLDSDVNALATARGRLGKTIGPAMLYATGGLAMAKIDTTVRNVSRELDVSNVHYGWAAGIGAELNIISGLAIRAEYMHVNFDEQRAVFPINGPQSNVDIEPSTNLLRAAVLFRF